MLPYTNTTAKIGSCVCINSICPYFYLKHLDQDEYQELYHLRVGKSLLLPFEGHFLLLFETLAQHFLLPWHLSQSMECCFLHHTNFVLAVQVPNKKIHTTE